MRGPITKQADVAHEIAHGVGLMMRDEIPDGVIQIKCRCDRYRGDSDADQPIEKGGTLHKQVLIAVILSGVEAVAQRTKPAGQAFNSRGTTQRSVLLYSRFRS